LSDRPQKIFFIPGAAIVQLAPGYGVCFATDMITVEGRRVAFMYREAPDRDVDSGWRFTSGFEDDEYMGNADNHGLYDVNTIANYDPDIIQFLDSPIGSAFEREDGVGPLREVLDYDPGDEPDN